jgi:hypothetical protein
MRLPADCATALAFWSRFWDSIVEVTSIGMTKGGEYCWVQIFIVNCGEFRHAWLHDLKPLTRDARALAAIWRSQ